MARLAQPLSQLPFNGRLGLRKLNTLMNILNALLRRAREGTLPADPIPLDSCTQPKYDSWLAGFEAHDAGIPFEDCALHSRSRPLWRQGWLASRRIDELVAEQASLTGDL